MRGNTIHQRDSNGGQRFFSVKRTRTDGRVVLLGGNINNIGTI